MNKSQKIKFLLVIFDVSKIKAFLFQIYNIKNIRFQLRFLYNIILS